MSRGRRVAWSSRGYPRNSDDPWLPWCNAVGTSRGSRSCPISWLTHNHASWWGFGTLGRISNRGDTSRTSHHQIRTYCTYSVRPEYMRSLSTPPTHMRPSDSLRCWTTSIEYGLLQITLYDPNYWRRARRRYKVPQAASLRRHLHELEINEGRDIWWRFSSI